MAKKKKSKSSQNTPQKTPPRHEQLEQEEDDSIQKHHAIALSIPSKCFMRKSCKNITEENEKMIYIHETDAREFNVRNGDDALVVQIDVKDDRGPASMRKKEAWSPSHASITKNDGNMSFICIAKVQIPSASNGRGQNNKFASPNGKKTNFPKEGEARLMPTSLAIGQEEAVQINIETPVVTTPTIVSTPSSAKKSFTFEGFVSSPSPSKTSTPVKCQTIQKYIALISLQKVGAALKSICGDAKKLSLELDDPDTCYFSTDVLEKSSKIIEKMITAFCNQKYFCANETITISFQGKKLRFKITNITFYEESTDASELNKILTPMGNLDIQDNSRNIEKEQTLADKINKDLQNESLKLGRITYKTTLSFNFMTKEIIMGSETKEKETNRKITDTKLVAGLDDIQSKLKSFLVPTLYHPEHFPRNGPIRAKRGLLLHGSSGCGKTLLADQIALDMHGQTLEGSDFIVEVEKVNCASIQSSVSIVGEAEKKLAKLFERGEKRAIEKKVSTLIILDDIHLICPRRGASGQAAGVERVASTLLALMDGIGHLSVSDAKQSGNVVVLAITSNPSSLDPALRRAGRLDTELEIPSPDDKAKAEILKFCLDKLSLDNIATPNLSETDFMALSRSAKGFTGADCTLSIKEAVRMAISKDSNSIENDQIYLSLAIIKKAIFATKPSAIKAVTVEIPKVPWDSIGGMDSVKRSLREAIELPMTHGHLFKALKIPPPRGVLLYGPPGCSKTLMARALASEGNMNFLAVKGPELLSKWLGESERALAALFRRARLASPCVIFFDEIDAIASKRGSSEGAGGERMLSQLLTEIDGCTTSSYASKDGKQIRIVVVGATNRPDILDPALTRPGRIDRMIYVGVPDQGTRKAIFDLQLKGKSHNPSIDLDVLASATEGYSGAEIVSISRESALFAIEESDERTDSIPVINMKHLQKAIDGTRKQITPAMIEFYKSFGKKAVH